MWFRKHVFNWPFKKDYCWKSFTSTSLNTQKIASNLMTWNSDDVPMVFCFVFSAGLSCQRSGGSAGNQLGPVIQTISTSELSVRINSRKKKKEEENITILCHHMAAEKNKTSIAGGAAVPGVVHYTSSTANGIY